MARYYKSTIYSNEFYSSSFKLVVKKVVTARKWELSSDSSSKIMDYFKYSDIDLNKTVKDLDSLKNPRVDVRIKREYDKLFTDIIDLKVDKESRNSNAETETDIIYEKIFDEDGNEYGKELITGAIFPIETKFTDLDISYSSSSNINSLCECVYYKILVQPEIKFTDGRRIDYFLADEVIANENELNVYINQFKGIDSIIRKRRHISRVKYYSDSNYLGDDIKFVSAFEQKERLKEEQITKEMQELEFMLARLKSISLSDYEKLNSEYQALLNQDNLLSLNPLSLKSIIDLESKAKITFLCNGGDAKHVIDYIDNQVKIYLNNYVENSNTKTELTIDDIDNIIERILSIKSSYGVKEQNDILKHLSLLYFFEIYENIDVFTVNQLKNSYVVDNIKRIVTTIIVLQEEGIIKTVPNMLYTTYRLDDLLYVISKIEFNSCEEVKDKAQQFIKRIQNG